MARLVGYSDLSKVFDDLYNRDFHTGQILTVYARDKGFTFKSSLKQKPSPSGPSSTCGTTFLEYRGPCLALTQELSSNSNSKVILEFIPESYRFIKTKIELESNSKKNTLRQLASIEYIQPNHRNKIAITDELAVKLTSVFKMTSTDGAGVNLVYDPSSSRLIGYNASLWMFHPDYRAVLKHVSTDKKKFSLGNIVGSFYYSKVKDLVAGAGFSYTKDGFAAQAIVQSNLGEGRILKTRATLDGQVGVALRTKVTSDLTVVTAAQFGIFDPTRSMQFGLRVKLNR